MTALESMFGPRDRSLTWPESGFDPAGINVGKPAEEEPTWNVCTPAEAPTNQDTQGCSEPESDGNGSGETMDEGGFGRDASGGNGGVWDGSEMGSQNGVGWNGIDRATESGNIPVANLNEASRNEGETVEDGEAAPMTRENRSEAQTLPKKEQR
jgi:hypothetical protein